MGHLPVYKALPTPLPPISHSQQSINQSWWEMLTPHHLVTKKDYLDLGKGLPKFTQWDGDKATTATRLLESPFQCHFAAQG